MLSTFMTHIAAVLDYSRLPQPAANSDTVSTIITVVAGIAASIAVLIAVIGGFRYILARGNPQETANAKNAIIYAVVGLVVVMLAYSIVLFVVRNIA